MQEPDGFCLGFLDDAEAVDGELDLVFAAQFLGAGFDVRDLFLETLEGVAVHEVVVGGVRAVVASVDGVSALEDEGVRASGAGERLGRKRVVVKLVEVAFEAELVRGPDSF